MCRRIDRSCRTYSYLHQYVQIDKRNAHRPSVHKQLHLADHRYLFVSHTHIYCCAKLNRMNSATWVDFVLAWTWVNFQSLLSGQLLTLYKLSWMYQTSQWASMVDLSFALMKPWSVWLVKELINMFFILGLYCKYRPNNRKRRASKPLPAAKG